MRSLRQLCLAAVLTASFTLPVLAGDMGGPSSNPSPGDMGGPSSNPSPGGTQGPTRTTSGFDNATLASALFALQGLVF